MGEPFAVYYADENRRLDAASLPRKLARLRQRNSSSRSNRTSTGRNVSLPIAGGYRDAGHRLAAQAERDLQDFVRSAESLPAGADRSD